MRVDKLHFEHENWVVDSIEQDSFEDVELVLVFGNRDTLRSYDHSSMLKKLYPNATIVGTSTAGNILNTTVSDLGAIGVAISFEKGHISVNSKIISLKDTQKDAQNLIESINKKDLKHIFVLAQDLDLNGSEIVRGLNLNNNISVTGGMAGDNLIFEETYIFVNEIDTKNLAVAIGFHGDTVNTGIGCAAGWDNFGAKRVVTKSDGNIVYEIDNKPALELYELYLGDYIKELPNSALYFPLGIQSENKKNEIIRVMMHINKDKSIVFAGDVPEGSIVRLMKTNVNNLIDGAKLSAQGVKQYNNKKTSLTLVVSCSARLSILKQFAEEEIVAVEEVIDHKTQIVGFYSYGEIAPFSNELKNCVLHNQTMTVTTIYED